MERTTKQILMSHLPHHLETQSVKWFFVKYVYLCLVFLFYYRWNAVWASEKTQRVRAVHAKKYTKNNQWRKPMKEKIDEQKVSVIIQDGQILKLGENEKEFW